MVKFDELQTLIENRCKVNFDDLCSLYYYYTEWMVAKYPDV